jgi:hypothetical protein
LTKPLAHKYHLLNWLYFVDKKFSAFVQDLPLCSVRVWEKRVILAALEDFAFSEESTAHLSASRSRTESETSD